MSIRFLKLSLASPDSIRSWTERILPNGKRVGKILKGDLIDYKNGLPIRDGLSCERIFGPMVSFTCTCGRFKCIETRGIHIVHDTLRSSRPILPDVVAPGGSIKVKQWDEHLYPFKTDIFGSKIAENETGVHPIVPENKISMTIQKKIGNEKPGKKKSTEPLEFSILQPIAYRQKKMIRFLRDFYYDYEFTYHSTKNETVPSFVSILKEPFKVTLTTKNSFKPKALWYYSKKEPIFQWFNLFFPMKSVNYKICSKGDPRKTNLLLKTHLSRIQNLLKPLYKFLFQIYTRFWFDLKVDYNNFIYEKHIFLWMPNRTFKTSKVYDNFKVHSSFFNQLKIQGLHDKSQKLPITNQIFCNETIFLNSKRFNLPFWLKNWSFLTKIIQNNTLQKTNLFFFRAIKTPKTCNIWYQLYLLTNGSDLKSFYKDPKYSYLLLKNFSSFQLLQRYTHTDPIWRRLYFAKLTNHQSILFRHSFLMKTKKERGRVFDISKTRLLKKSTVNSTNQKFDLKTNLREEKNVSLKALTAFTLYDHKKTTFVLQELPNRGNIANILFDFRKISRVDFKQNLSNPFQKLLFTLKKNRNSQNTAWTVFQSSVLAHRENKNNLSLLSNKTAKFNKNKKSLKPVCIFDFFKKQENTLFQSNKKFYSTKAYPLLNSNQKPSASLLSYSGYQSPQIEKTFFPKKVETVSLNSAPITHNEDISKSSVGSNIKQNIRVYKFKNFPPEEIRYCPYCEVELLPNSIRRYRLGYIEFVSPVAHIWYTANSIPLLLNLSKTMIEGIASCHEALSSGFPPVYKWSYNGESPTSWTFQMQPLTLPVNPIPKMVPINEILEIGTIKKSHFTEIIFGFNSTTGFNGVRPRTILPLLYAQKSNRAVFSMIQSTDTYNIAGQKFLKLLTLPFQIVSYNLTSVPCLWSENDLKIYERRMKNNFIKNTKALHKEKEKMSKSKKEESLYHDLQFFSPQINSALNDFYVNHNFKIFNSKNNTKKIGKKTLIKSQIDPPYLFWKDISYKFKYLWMFEYHFDKSLPKNSWFTPISSKILPSIANGFEKQKKERPRQETLYAKQHSKTLPLRDNLSGLDYDFSPNVFYFKRDNITEAMNKNSKMINFQNKENHSFINQKKIAKQFFFMCLLKNNDFNPFFSTITPFSSSPRGSSFFHVKLLFHNKKNYRVTNFIGDPKKIEITNNHERAKNKQLRSLPIVGTLHVNRLFSQFLLKSFKKEYVSRRNSASMLSTESKPLFFRRASLLKSKPLNMHTFSYSYKLLGKNAEKQMSGSACRFTPCEAMEWNPTFEYPREKWLSVKDKSLFSFQVKLVSFFNISNETMREFSFFNKIPKKVNYDSDLYTASEYEKKREWLKLEGFFEDPSDQKLPDDSQQSVFNKSKTNPLLDSQENKTDHQSRVQSKTDSDFSNQKHLKSQNETKEKNENDFQSFENLSLPLVLPFLGKNPDNIEFQSNYSNYENFNLDPLKFITDLFSTQHLWDYTDNDYNHSKDTYKLQTETNHDLEIFMQKKQDNDISNNLFNTYHDPLTRFSNKYTPTILYNHQTIHKKDDLVEKSYYLNKLQCNFSRFLPSYQSNQENGFWPSLNRFYVTSDHLFSKTCPFLTVSFENSLFQDVFKPTKKENLFLGREGVQKSLENLDTEDFKLSKNDDSLPFQAWNLNRLNNQIKFNLSNLTNDHQNYQNCFRKLGRTSYYFRVEQMTRLENENAFLKNLFYRKIFQKTSILKNGSLVLPFISVANVHSINGNQKIRLKSNILKKNYNFLIEKRTRFLFGFYLNAYDGFNFFKCCSSKIKYPPSHSHVKIKNRFFSSIIKYNFPSDPIFNKIKNKFGIGINKKYFTASIKTDKSFLLKNNFKNSLWPIKSNIKNSYQKLSINSFYILLHKSVENLHRPWCHFKNTLPTNFLNQSKLGTINSKIDGSKSFYVNSLNYLQYNWFSFLEISQNYASFKNKRWSLKLAYLLKNKYFNNNTFYCDYKWLKTINTQRKRLQFFFWTPNYRWQLEKQKSINMKVPISMIYDLIISRSYFINSTPSLKTKQIENKRQWFEDLEILYAEKRLKEQYFSAFSVTPIIRFENLMLKTCYKSNHIIVSLGSIYHNFNSSHDMRTLAFLTAKKTDAFKIMTLVNLKKPCIRTLNNYSSFVNTKVKLGCVLELHKHGCFRVKPDYFFKYVQSQTDPKKGTDLNKQPSSIFKNFKHYYFSKAWQSLKQKVNYQPNLKISFSGETIKVKQQLSSLALLGFSTTKIEFFGSLKIYAKRRFLEITHHPSQNLKNITGFLFHHRFKNFKLKTRDTVNQKHLYANLINGSFLIIEMNKADFRLSLPFDKSKGNIDGNRDSYFSPNIKNNSSVSVFSCLESAQYSSHFLRPKKCNSYSSFINGIATPSVSQLPSKWLQKRLRDRAYNNSLSFSTETWFEGRSYSTVSLNFFRYVNKNFSLTKKRQTKSYVNKSFLVWLNLYQSQQKIVLPGKNLPFLINIKTQAINIRKEKVSSRIVKYLSLNHDYHSTSSRLAKLLIEPYKIANLKHLYTMKHHKNVICYAYAIETIQNKKQIHYSKIPYKNFKSFESGSKRFNDIQSLSFKMSCFSYCSYSPIASLNLGNRLIIPKKSTYQPKIIVQKIPKQIPLLKRFEQTPCILRIRNGHQSTIKSSIFDVLGPQSLRILKRFKTLLGSCFFYTKEKCLFLKATKNSKHINRIQSKYDLNVQVVNLGIFKDSSRTQIFKWGNRGHIFVFDKLTKNNNYHNDEIPYPLKKLKHNYTKNTENSNQEFLAKTDNHFPSTNCISEKSFQNRFSYSGSLVNEKPKNQAWEGNTNYYACISQITSWGSDHGSWILFLKYIRANIYKGDQVLPYYFNKMNFQMMPRTGSIMLQQLLSQLQFIPKALDKNFSLTERREPYSISKQKSVPEIATWQKFATNRKRDNDTATRQFKNKTDHKSIVREVIDHYYFHYDSSFFSSSTPGTTDGNKNFSITPNQFLKGHKSLIHYKTFSLFNGLVFLKKNLQKAIEMELSNILIKKPSFLSNNNCTPFSTIGLNTDYIFKSLIIKKNSNQYKTNLFGYIINKTLLACIAKNNFFTHSGLKTKQLFLLLHKKQKSQFQFNLPFDLLKGNGLKAKLKPKCTSFAACDPINNKTKDAYSFFTSKTKPINTMKHSMNRNNNYALYAYKIKKPVANKRFRQISQLHLPKPINNWYRLNHFFSYSQTTTYSRVKAKNKDFRIKKKIYESYLDTSMLGFTRLINNDIRILKLIYSLIVSFQLQFLPINQRDKQYNYSLSNHKELFNPLFFSRASKVSRKTINKSLTHKIFNTYYHIYINKNLKHELCSFKSTFSNLSTFFYSQKANTKHNYTISNGKTFDGYYNSLLQNSLWLRSYSIKSKDISRFFNGKPRSLKYNNLSYLLSDSAYRFKKSQAALGAFCLKKNKITEAIESDQNLERKNNYTKSVLDSPYNQNYLENFYFSNQKIKIYNLLISPFEMPKSRFFNFNLHTTPFDFVKSKSNRSTLNSLHKSRKSLKSLLPLKNKKWSYHRPLKHFISYIRPYNDNVSNFYFNETHHMKKHLYNSQKNTFTNNKNWLEGEFKCVLPVSFETYKGEILSETLFIKLKEIGNYNLLMKKKNTLFKTLIVKMNSSLRPLFSGTCAANENQIQLPSSAFGKAQECFFMRNEKQALQSRLMLPFDTPKGNLKPKYASINDADWVDSKKENTKARALEFFTIWLFLDGVYYSHLYSFNDFQSDYRINPTLITNKLPYLHIQKIKEPQHSNFFSKILQFYEYRKNFLLKKIFKQRVRLTQYTAWKPSVFDQSIALKTMPTMTKSFDFLNHLSKLDYCRENSIGDPLTLGSSIFDVKPEKASFLNATKWLIFFFLQKNKFKIWLEAYILLTRNINIFYDQERNHNIKYEFKTFGPQIKHTSSYSDYIKSFKPQIYHLRNTTVGSFKNEIRFRLLRVPKIFDLGSTLSFDPSGWFCNKTNLEKNDRPSVTNQNHLLSMMQKKNVIPINIFGPLIFSSSIKPLKKKIKQWPEALPVLKVLENQPFWGTSTIFDYDFQKFSYNIMDLNNFYDPISNSRKFEFNENTQLKVSNNDYNTVFDEKFNGAPIYHETFLNPDLPLSSETLFRKENLKVSSSYKALLQKAKILEDYPVPNPDPLDSKSIYLKLLNGDCARFIGSHLKGTTILCDKLPLFGTRFVSHNKNFTRPCLYSQKNTEANRINWGKPKNSITNTPKLLFRFLWDGNQNRFKNISFFGLNYQSRDPYWADSKKESMEADNESKLDNLSIINKKTIGSGFINKTTVPSKNVFSMRDQTKLKNETMTNLNDGTRLSVFNDNRSSDNTNSISELKKKSGYLFKNQEILFTGQKQVELEKRKDTFTDLVKNSKSTRNNSSLHYGRNLRKLRLQYLRNFRRLRFIEYLKATYIKPEWMILSLLPVLPPDLRPVIANPRGYITGDINTHYQNVIYRNNNIEKLLDTFWIPRKFYSKTSFTDYQKRSTLMFSSIKSYFYSVHYLPVYQKRNQLCGLKNRYFISKFFSKLTQFPVTFLYENKLLASTLFLKQESPEKAPMSSKNNEWLISFPDIDSLTGERKPINQSVKVLQNNVSSTPTTNVFSKTPLTSVLKDRLTVSKNIENTNRSVFKRLPFHVEVIKHNEFVKKPFSFLINRLLFSNLIVFNDISQSNLSLSINNQIGVDQNPRLIHSVGPKPVFGFFKKSVQLEQLFKNSKAKVIDWKLERLISPMFSKFTTPCWQVIENEPSMLKAKLIPSFENFQTGPSSDFFSKKTRTLILLNNEPLQQELIKNEQNNFLDLDQANHHKLHTKNFWFYNSNQSGITENFQAYKKPTCFHLYLSPSRQEDYFYKPLLKFFNHASFFGSNIGIATGYNEIVQTFKLKTLNDESAFAKNSEILIKKSSIVALKTKIIRTQALHDSKPLQEMQYSLQKAVDALIDNSQKLQTNILLRKGRPLKSLSDNLKGKEGRFRQHLLGKRVDYSGRSVIVVGPDLKLYECGIPLIMALRLFQPFLILYLIYRFKIASLLATQLIQRKHPMVINLLKKFIETWPILLNRAPTLHRMNIQAFKIRLVQGKAILLHPLVCSSYNADFDGDQMGVHVPITQQARAESWKLLWSINNSIAIASRQPLFLPSQDMVIGNYYLTAPPIDNSLTFLIPKKPWPLNLNIENKTLPLCESSKFDPKLLSKNSTVSLDHNSTVYYPLGKQWHNDFQKNNHYFFSLEEAYQYYLNIAYRLHINTPVWFRFCMIFETSEREKAIEITLDKQGNTIYTTKFYEKQLKRNRIMGKNTFYFNIHLNSFITQPLSKKESIKPLFNSIQKVDKDIISAPPIIFNKSLRPIPLNQLIRSTFGRIEFYYEAFHASSLALKNNN